MCQIFPWLKAEISHHTTYENVGHEKWNIDCIVVSRVAHKFIVSTQYDGVGND